uniref:Uncharacterized protein n=1 Tax=Plectus sambesii TaxID=2011161 RepID=A0A914X4L3_9BILA
MDEEEARVLTKLADTVCKNVTSASQMLTILQSEETITDIDVQEIESRGPMYQQVKQLITILKTKRQNKKQVERGVKRPFEALCFALQTMGQHWLAEELATELKKASSNASNFGQLQLVFPHS